MAELLTIANVLVLLANVAVFGLSLKLYTEYFKDKAQDKRVAARGVAQGSQASDGGQQ